MTQGKMHIIVTSAIFAAACMIAFLVLNRWLVTDIGFLSYGRVWQLYVSYFDFGFTRRAFIGTILTASGINSLFENEYHFAISLHHVAILALSILIAYYCIARKISDSVFIASIAFSPALIIHSGYSTGSLDVFVLLIAAINILFVRNIFLFSTLIIIGILVHELFIFTVPAQLFALHLNQREVRTSSLVRTISFPLLALVLGSVLTIFFGTVDMSRETMEEIMKQKLPNAAGQHGLWSGYREIAATVDQDTAGAISALSSHFPTGLVWLALPLIYVATLIARLWRYSKGAIERSYLIFAVIAPLATALVATDYHRWVAMSANMAILLTLVYARNCGKANSRWNMPLLVFCLLAPFGGAQIDRPFPMHQLVLERFMN